MKRVLILLFFFSGLATVAFGQPTTDAKQENIQNCLDGLGSCNRSLLTPPQASQLASVQHDQNLWTCFSGYGNCNQSLLTSDELREVREYTKRENLFSCETVTLAWIIR